MTIDSIHFICSWKEKFLYIVICVVLCYYSFPDMDPYTYQNTDLRRYVEFNIKNKNYTFLFFFFNFYIFVLFSNCGTKCSIEVYNLHHRWSFHKRQWIFSCRRSKKKKLTRVFCLLLNIFKIISVCNFNQEQGSRKWISVYGLVGHRWYSNNL